MKITYTTKPVSLNFISRTVMLIGVLALGGCQDFVNIDLPNTKITTGAVFDSDATAQAAALGMYDIMLRPNSFGASGATASITTLTGIYSDELKNYYAQNAIFAENNLVASNTTVLSLWSSLYSAIYASNTVIEGVTTSQSMTASMKTQLEGEAKFVRAFCHFYLVNLFGNVPLVQSTDYRANASAPRKASDEIYDAIIADLISAQELLGNEYISADRGRPNKWAATALLARVYLFTENWTNAEAQADAVINQTELFILSPDLDKVFKSNSGEAIWQLVSTLPTSYNTYEGRYFIVTTTPSVATIRQDLLDSFEDGDERLTSWVGAHDNGAAHYTFPYKYKVKGGSNPLTEHSAVFRLAEMYLIRAEARIHQNNLSDAASDINTIRNRAGLSDTPATTTDELLLAVEQERRIELFSEWGHRWFDIKRTGRAESILAPIKTGWNSEDILFPIPDNELNNNPNLKPQNPGY